MAPEHSGDGPDGGRDLLARARVDGPLRDFTRTWVVECKDHSESGRSVGLSEVQSIADRLLQHRADGFLLVVTTGVSSGLKARLDAIHQDPRTGFVTQVWDGDDLTRMLLEPGAEDLLRQYFPEEYATRTDLDSSVRRLEQEGVSPEALRALLMAARGSDERTPRLSALIEHGDIGDALRMLGSLEFESWERQMIRLGDETDQASWAQFLEYASMNDDEEGRRFHYLRQRLEVGEHVSHLLPALSTLEDDSVAILLEEAPLLGEVELQVTHKLQDYGGDEYDVDGGHVWAISQLEVVELSAAVLRFRVVFMAELNCSVGAGSSFPLNASGHAFGVISELGLHVEAVHIDLPDLTE